MKSTQRTHFDSLIVIKLGRGEWRVSSAADPDELLGYIERQRAGRFEIVWMSDPMRWAYIDTFDAALVAFGDSVRFTGEIFPQRARAVGGSSRGRMPSRAASTAHRSSWIKPGGRWGAA